MLDPARSAFLVLDVQNDIVANYLGDGATVLSRLERLVTAARRRGVRVVHVTLAFRPGYPEIGTRNPGLLALRQARRLVLGTPGAAAHDCVAPLADEMIIVKHRASAFAGTDLDTILGAHGIDTLILGGIATSGAVLSTLRQASDLDYELIVVADACADRDADVHRVLVERVFPKQARVVDTIDMLGELGG